MARHKSRVRHTRRRRSSTRSRKQSGGWLFGLFGNKEAPAPAATETKPWYARMFGPAEPTKVVAEPTKVVAEPTKVVAAPAAGGGRRKKSRKHHRRRHRK